MLTALPAASASAASSSCAASALVGVARSDGAITRWAVADTDAGAPASPRTVVPASGDAPVLVATDRASGDLFTTQRDGTLLLRRWTGTTYGAATRVGGGWTVIRQLAAAGRGVLYALDTSGSLRWYRWTGSAWASGSGRVLETGWAGVRVLASGGDGVLYGIRADGSLAWWSLADPTTGLAALRGPVTVGWGWQVVSGLTGAGDGLLYALTTDGALRVYNHLGAQRGVATWAATRTVPGSWSSWRSVTLSPDACSSPADTAESFARAQIGDPYAYGASGPDAWDCSGLTMKSWAAAAVTLPRMASDQAVSRSGTRLPFAQRRPGDLVFWSSNGTAAGVYHVATYVGDGKVVSAPKAGTLVRLQDVWTTQLMPTVLRPAG